MVTYNSIQVQLQETSGKFISIVRYFKPNNYFMGSSVALVSYLINYYLVKDSNSVFAGNDELTILRRDFIRKDEALNVASVLAIGFGFWCLVLTIVIFLLINKIYFNKKANDYSIDELYKVVDSMLADSFCPLDKRLELLKVEMDNALADVVDIVDAKCVQNDNKLVQIQTYFNDCKNYINTEHQQIKALMKQIPHVLSSIQSFDEDMGKSNSKMLMLNAEVDRLSTAIETENAQITENYETFKSKMTAKLDFEEMQLFKCNSLLVNAKILFEASLARFESIISAIKSNTEFAEIASESKENILPSESETKLESLLKDALTVIGMLKQAQGQGSGTILDLEDHVMSDASLNTEENATSSLIFDIAKRMEMIESQVNSQARILNRNSHSLKSINSSKNEQVIEMKNLSDEWIISWVSVIYSLFNSSFHNLQDQLLGNDNFDSINILIEEVSEIGTCNDLLSEFVSHCKDVCLKVMKEIILLIFEYYLIHRDFNKTGNSILSVCKDKIEFDVDNLHTLFEEAVSRTDMTKEKRNNILKIIATFKDKLKLDMNLNTVNFNSLFKQNLQDFFIIYDTMKVFIGEENKKNHHGEHDVHKDDVYDNDIIEISDDFNDSDISVHTSIFSSDGDTSLMSNNSYKPFKLKKKA